MKNSLYLYLLVMMVLFSTATAQEELTNDYNIIHKEPFEGLKLKEAWVSKIPISNINKVWTTWNSVLLQTSNENHSIYSIKKESGVVRWIHPIGFTLDHHPSENINGFYILNKNMVYVLDPLQGGLMKKITMNHAVAGNVAASQFGLFSYEWGKKLHMIKTDDNFKEAWANKIDGELHTYATPTIRQSLAYIPSPDGTFYCYDARGDKIWQFVNTSVFEDMEYFGRAIDSVDVKISKERQQSSPDLKKIKTLRTQRDYYEAQIKSTYKRKRGKFLSEPAFYKEFVFVGSTDGSLYCLNRFSGNPQWEYLNGEPVLGAIVPISDQVIFFLENQGAVSIDRGTNSTQLRWKLKEATEVLNVTDKNIYFRTVKQEVLCVDRKFGQEQWRWKIKAGLEVVQDLTDDAIIVVDKNTRDGHISVYALTELGNLPKVDDKESLPDVGFAFYDEIDKAKEAKVKEELEKAEKLKKAAEGGAEEKPEAGKKKPAKAKTETPN